ncbi:MAG: methionyl-tRNA formyltransferase [Burkholderiales bacterium RIFCSPHIGHO2_12_FULL_69_20]|nr:MAG: methionyl-tRNA formyltransferase [Burkholderiales bacterium RIFCSPHIGHO2_12_FULL_69_20]
MRIVFAGTPEFAATALAALLHAGHEVALVLTQPDRPAGRGLKLQPSPVKALALQQGITVAQPRSLRLDGKFPDDARAAQAALLAAFSAGRAEVMVVAAYGLILPQWVLDLPPRGCLNIHASVLPRWRGAAPIHRAIEAGDAATGITLMQMDAGLDTGDMLLVAHEAIRADDTTATLHDRLAALGGQLVVQGLVDPDRLQRTPQPAEGVTYAHKIDKAEAAIDWTQPAAVIERRVRAFDPFPGASFKLDGEAIKLWRAALRPDQNGRPGEVLTAQDGLLTVACGDGALDLLQLQRPGGRRIDTAAWLQARPGLAGRCLLPT